MAKKAIVKKTVAPKAAVKKASVGSSRTTSRVAAARKSTSARGPVRGGLTASVDYTTIVSKLQKLSNSRSEQVALDACKALLSLR